MHTIFVINFSDNKFPGMAGRILVIAVDLDQGRERIVA